MAVDLGLDGDVQQVVNISGSAIGWADNVQDLLVKLIKSDSANNPFGSAALVDTGIASGNVPVLDGNGDLLDSVIPNLAANKITSGTLADARLSTNIARTSQIPSNSDIDERARDAVGMALVGSQGISITLNDTANTITVQGPDLSGYATTANVFTQAQIEEFARDAIGTALLGSQGISISPDDATNRITITGPDLSTYALKTEIPTVPSNSVIDERARDAVGVALRGQRGITITPNDSANTITITGPDLSSYALSANVPAAETGASIVNKINGLTGTSRLNLNELRGSTGANNRFVRLNSNGDVSFDTITIPSAETGSSIANKLGALSGTARLNLNELRGSSGSAGRFVRIGSTGDVSFDTITIPSAETGSSIATKLAGLTGSSRLDVSELKSSTGAAGRFLGVNANGDISAVAAPSGGTVQAETGASIVQKLGALTGTNRLHLNRLRVNTSTATIRYMVANSAGDLRTTTLNIPAVETGTTIANKLASLTGGSRLNVSELRSTTGAAGRFLGVDGSGNISAVAAPSGGGTISNVALTTTVAELSYEFTDTSSTVLRTRTISSATTFGTFLFIGSFTISSSLPGSTQIRIPSIGVEWTNNSGQNVRATIASRNISVSTFRGWTSGLPAGNIDLVPSGYSRNTAGAAITVGRSGTSMNFRLFVPNDSTGNSNARNATNDPFTVSWREGTPTNVNFSNLVDIEENLTSSTDDVWIARLLVGNNIISEGMFSSDGMRNKTAQAVGVSTANVDKNEGYRWPIKNTSSDYFVLSRTTSNALIFGIAGWTNSKYPQPEVQLERIEIVSS